MFSRPDRTRSHAGRLLAVLVVAVLGVGLLSGGLLVGGMGLGSSGGDDAGHSGVALAQSEDEENDSGGTTVIANDENESDSPTDERAASEVPGESAEGVNDTDTENRSATQERAGSEGVNESTADEYEDDEGGIGFVAQRFLDMVSGVTTQIQNEFGELLSMMLEYAVSRSAPGVADDPSTWGSPEEQRWQGAIDVMNVTRLMGFLFGLGMVFYSAGTYGISPRESKRRLITAIPVAVFLLKPEFWIGLTLHGSTTISTTLSPSADALATPEGILAAGLGVIAAGLLAASSMSVIVLATLVTVIAHEAGLATTAFLPLAASFFLGPMYLRSIGEMVVYLHGVTVIMPIFQALGTLAVVRIFFSGGGVLTSLSGVLALLGTVYLLYYLFQREVLEKAFDAPIVSLGVHGAQMSADGAKNVAQAPQKMRDIRASIQQGLDGARSRFSGSDGSGGGSGSGGSGWRPDIGKIQTPSLSAGRSNSGGTAAVADGGSDGAGADPYPHTQSSGSSPDAASWGTRPVGRDEQGRFQSIDSLQENRERNRLANGDY